MTSLRPIFLSQRFYFVEIHSNFGLIIQRLINSARLLYVSEIHHIVAEKNSKRPDLQRVFIGGSGMMF